MFDPLTGDPVSLKTNATRSLEKQDSTSDSQKDGGIAAGSPSAAIAAIPERQTTIGDVCKHFRAFLQTSVTGFLEKQDFNSDSQEDAGKPAQAAATGLAALSVRIRDFFSYAFESLKRPSEQAIVPR
jgi:hypothetical protein